MISEIKCPQCQKRVCWQDNPDRPFCSERCRLLDLGQWADESYKIYGQPQDSLSDENVVYLNEKKEDIER